METVKLKSLLHLELGANRSCISLAPCLITWLLGDMEDNGISYLSAFYLVLQVNLNRNHVELN